MRLKYSKEKMENIVKESFSIADVLRKLGLVVLGGNYKTINKYIQIYDLDCDHFTGQLWSKGKQLKDLRHYTSLCTLKEHFIKIVSYNCVLCGMGAWYNDKNLVLHLDHIDGNNLNNSKENLRLLCPNCHSQTETYCAKNKAPQKEETSVTNDFSYIPDGFIKELNPVIKKEKTLRVKKINYCGMCQVEIQANSKKCAKCNVNSQPKKFEVSKEDLEKLIKLFPMTKIGEMFGVSDQAIKSRIKKLEIKIGDMRGYWAKINAGQLIEFPL